MENLFLLVLQVIISYGISRVLYPIWIAYLKRINVKQSVSEYALKEYQEKSKVPILGGVLFVVIPTMVTFLFVGYTFSVELILMMLAGVGFGVIGLLDDVKIIKEGKNDGLSGWVKLGLQVIIGMFVVGVLLLMRSTEVMIFVESLTITLPWWLFAGFALFILVGSSNAVNLTDGMDGLAGGTSLLVLVSLSIIAYSQGQLVIASYLVSLVGALLAYLHFNVFPAQIYMGDTGSLALGGFMAAAALLLQVEFSYAILAGVFVWETVCVILQIGSVKLFKRRIFKYTPIHYSFVLNGWKEKQVVHFIWMLGFLFAIIGLWTAIWL